MAAISAAPGANAASLNALLGVKSPDASAAEGTSDRFLKLLVTQMQNQDPLNPMDNAQVTSQMAQINTVSGIGDLNKALGGMNALLLQMQSLQGAALVGREVLLSGNSLVLDGQGQASGGFELDSTADALRVNVHDSAGHTVDSFELGAQGPGRHSFDWQSSDAQRKGLSFSVVASAGSVAVNARALVSDKVRSVYTDGGRLMVELQGRGAVDYADVRAFN